MSGAAKSPARGGLHGAPPRPGLRTPALPGTRIAETAAGLTARTARSTVARITRPLRPSSLDERDPDHLRDQLARMWIVASVWFRAEVRGMGNIPATGPVILLGNHSGGHMTPDTYVFTMAFATYFGTERRLHLLTDSHVFSLPGFGNLRRSGVVSAGAGHLREGLETGGVVYTYPGGSREAHRASWHSSSLDLGDLDATIEIAAEFGVPIVPVVAIGGQETALFLGSGESVARRLRLDRLGIDRVPLALALPWGLSVGDMLGHLPLPAKIVIEVLPPIDVVRRLADGAGVTELGEHVRTRMQDTLDALKNERSLPVIG